MDAGTFPPLPDLAFEAVLDGTAVFARYRDNGGRAYTVERRAGGGPEAPDHLPANDLAGVVARVVAIHTVGDARFLVYDDAFVAALPARIHDRAWSPVERLRTLEAMARGLAALHERGIVHGDLTPDALLFDERGALRFAALTPLAAPSESMTAAPSDARTFGPTLNRVRATGGALAYLAPEQFMARTTLAESDVFAWGCIAYEVATGRSAFGFVTDPSKLLDAIARGPQRAVHEVEPGYAPAFGETVRAALAVDRKQRSLPASLPAEWVVHAEAARPHPVSSGPSAATRPTLVPLLLLVVASAIGYFALAR
jgi:serine/threonine protein kinase